MKEPSLDYFCFKIFLRGEPIKCNLDGPLILTKMVHFTGWTFYRRRHLISGGGGNSELFLHALYPVLKYFSGNVFKLFYFYN